MKKNIIVFASLSFLVACSGPQSETVTAQAIKTYPEIEKLSWLSGEWVRNSLTDFSSEKWEKKNDSTLYGVGLTMEGKDTVAFESMTIEQKNNTLYYIPVVKDQNAGQAVEFALTSSNKNEWIFENPKHDFPTKIIYKKINNDSLYAEISAVREGKEVKVPFPFARKKIK
ncbi:MAG: hypothetical protein H0W73_11505 [Bacteroidetes bacterium]|nr:hypothetical protein [Bacteroidota bacterium]